MKERYHLLDGLAYLELKAAYTTSYESDNSGNRFPLKSKNGDPMIHLKWSVCDKEGNIGLIDDYISSKSLFRIQNISNALCIKGFYDNRTCSFNPLLINGRNCAASIKLENQEYGSKIIKYLPLEFYKLLNDSLPKNISNNTSENVGSYESSEPLYGPSIDDNLPF